MTNDYNSILIIDTAADQCTCGGLVWVILNHTGEKIRCDGYIKGKSKMIGPTLPIVSAATLITPSGLEQDLFILIIYQACYHSEVEQTEILYLPYQAEQHGVRLDLNPRN